MSINESALKSALMQLSYASGVDYNSESDCPVNFVGRVACMVGNVREDHLARKHSVSRSSKCGGIVDIVAKANLLAGKIKGE